MACVYPTGYAPPPAMPAPCGIAYCCALDNAGNIIDKNPNCQPDPVAAAVCFPDMGVASTGGATTD
jgi:hypothetical protein